MTKNILLSIAVFFCIHSHAQNTQPLPGYNGYPGTNVGTSNGGYGGGMGSYPGSNAGVINCNCDDEAKAASEAKTKTRNILLKSLCSQPFSESLWSENMSRIKAKSEWDFDDATVVMNYLSKSNYVDYNLLIKVLTNKHLVKENQSTLIEIFMKNMNNFDYVMDKVKNDVFSQWRKDHGNKFDFKDSCLTKQEQTSLVDNLKNRIKSKLENSYGSKRYFDKIAPEIGLFYSETEKKKIAEDFADTILARNQDPRLSDSKRFYLAYNSLLKSMGEKYVDIIDAVVYNDRGYIEIFEVTLSDDDKGYSRKRIKGGYSSSGSKKETYDGTTADGRKYSTEITSRTFSKEEVKKFLPDAVSPDYSSMKKNGSYKGLVVLSSNLGPSDGDLTLKRYLAYYQSRGFIHDKEDADGRPATQKVASVKFITDQLSNKNAASYMIKEAHAEGDSVNLVMTSKESQVFRLKKPNKNGPPEEVLIMNPSYDYGPRSTIKNEAIAEVIKKREKENQGQLLYLNTSCGGSNSIPNMLAVAKSKNFVPIAVNSDAMTFNTLEDNYLRQTLDGIRNSKTYGEMSTATKSDRNLKKGYNKIIFPSDKEYQRYLEGSYIQDVFTDVQTLTKVQKPDGTWEEVRYTDH